MSNADKIRIQRELLEEMLGDDDDAPRRRAALRQWYADRRRITVVPGQDGNEPVLAARADLIARHRQADQPVPATTSRRLTDLGFTSRGSVVARREFLRFRSETAEDQQVAAAQGELDAAGFEVVPNHFFPLAWSVKGKEGPTPPDDNDSEPLGSVPGPRDPNQVVVVVDTGLAEMAPRSRTDGRLEYPDADADFGYDPLYRSGTTLDLGAGHGTSVAGVTEGINPNVSLCVKRALGPDAIGHEWLIARRILEAGRYIEEHGGKGVINLSFGAHTADDAPPELLGSAIERVLAGPAEIAFVAAAGNGGSARPMWPAAFSRHHPEVVGVAGLDADGNRTDWSSRGDWVQFSAPAEGIIAPFVVGTEAPSENDDDPYDTSPDTWQGANPNALCLGTSFAAPQVAARLAALIAQHGTVSGAMDALVLEGTPGPAGFGVKLSLF